MDAATIIEEVNQLSPEDRSLVIDALLSSASDQHLSVLEASHVALVEARHRDFVEGKVAMEDAFLALQSVRKRLHATAH